MENTQDIKISYETLWKFIIRPPRDDYTQSMLGSKSFTYRKKKYYRKDYEIMSTQGYMMKCSFIEPLPQYRPSIEMPVVLYLHGNSSSRLEGLNMAGELLKRDINLFVIDFIGCGLSEGEYISLGYHESHDVENVINFIEKIPGVGNIGLWGRSMGAATTMIYSHRDNRVKAICLDSPFADFARLAKELTLKQINLPGFLVSGVLSIVRSTILKKNGLDIDKLKPIDMAEKTFQPAIFIHAINDELINVQHTLDLFNKYGGQEKSLKCCDKGGHNTRRSSMIVNEIGEFFKKYLFQSEETKGNEFNNTIINNNSIYEKIDNSYINKSNNSNIKKNENEKFSRRSSMEEEEPFNDKTIERIEYYKKKEEMDKNQMNKIQTLLKSMRQPEIQKAFNNNIKNNESNNNNIKNNYIKNNDDNNIKNTGENKKLEYKINNNIIKKNINNINVNKNFDIKNSNINFNNWKNGGKMNNNNH